ncbi:NAD-dependent succinate-semialdehyde dehydrogenase [Paracidovorax avenae]|uniref:Betaine-aldehyde dehydrogenase n=1 Tax=Paracidovorax avenae (strain ATCC 19860 / DSM 7227 / CCUG 15838 / JCM 20985 / LMG 2117 / NCPPB 1011) TaxID=643561 RepID=F0Q250_PARA1|nr:NAD-dependent succinate-semialdehyde dehydrogenase [Paracidovorax avenae]ADX45322.1 Betaine-aldehyde dehydrogenase [Paracidovorax avenae ATCC 19860]AVS61460.1 NAD-dependent succinate-semialdehyde dehydrogenase [Paracidovorax avenae]AVS70026.1 NAD-dependent succinate-semialdehyde dehydrogenase [Paracidovorax avenae]AVS77426.1 NAD-dependent succinate-semialdehyde dehydrogenase [Paracidovorax avenae]AVS80647.1 NAD-dependent succinate-semialdehyde dehydrogenase [Paracidovorax avenae]
MTYPSTRLFIAGEWQDAADGKTIAVHNPATGKEIGRVAHAGRADLDRALEAAQKGFEAWRDIPAVERARTMRRAAALMRERADAIARILTQEQGKPLAEAKVEAMAAADIIEWFADEGQRIYGRIVPARGSLAVRQLVLKDPVGPVAAFTPWNFPINQVVRKLAAALASGCSILVKAPEETPASPAELIRAFADAGVPAGTVGLVYGNPAEISSYLIPHPVIRKVTFTGSTPVGKQLAALAGQHMKRVTMELGGHAPVIVADDADVELAVKAAGGAKFRNAGQVCISPTRFLVHESIRKDFVAALARHAQALKVGDGLADGTQMGPLANPRRITAMAELMQDAVQHGAQVAAGGDRIGGDGNFFQPTVLDDVPVSARIFNEEPFGPVAAVRGFEKIEDAIAEANRLPYGLAGYAFTRSLKHAHLLSQRLEVGMLWINQPASPSAELPFGGLKDSGYGSEGGPEAIEAHLNTRAVSITNV